MYGMRICRWTDVGACRPRLGSISVVVAILLASGICSAQKKMIKVGAPLRHTLTEADRADAIETIAKLIAENYIFPEKGEETGQFLRKMQAEGQYSQITDSREFAEMVTMHMQEATGDAHLALRERTGVLQGEPVKIVVKKGPEDGLEGGEVEIGQEGQEAQEGEEGRSISSLPGFGRYYDYGFEKTERLPGNIGYLDLRVFDDPRDDRARATAEAAMVFLANSDAIIVDLRLNGGGTGMMADLLASYFFGEEPVHLLTNTTRFAGEEHTQKSWTHSEISGQRFPETDLYLLTSNRTGSAAEHFVFGLKGQGRATIVGEATGGAGHNIGFFPVLDLYDLSVAIGRTYDPKTGKGWQGTGIEPDISVPSADALEVAHKRALANLEKKAVGDQKSRLAWIRETLDVLYHPVVLEESVLRTYEGEYENGREITLDGGVLYYARRGMPYRLQLVPMSETSFFLSGKDDLRLQFTADETAGLRLLYEDGRTQDCIRIR